MTSFMADQIRPVNIAQDLPAIADLIELCFGQTMDEDGWEYVRQLRQSARDARYLHWAVDLMESSTLPYAGFVYEENGRIIGNLTLIPLFHHKKRIFLIANVAVRPEARLQGIGRHLTQRAVEYIKSIHASACWLQVREDNPVAEHIYLAEGFIKRAFRTTWLIRPGNPVQTPGTDLQPGPLLVPDWKQTNAWLAAAYPDQLRWNLTIKPEKFRPGFTSWLDRLLRNDLLRTWAAYDNQKQVGALFWEPSRLFSDSFWLAASPEYERKVIETLLPSAILELRSKKPLSLNYPAEFNREAFETIGFDRHLTLTWMELPLPGQLDIDSHSISA
jgi:GNAT superfamily N-acetyltransferase